MKKALILFWVLTAASLQATVCSQQAATGGRSDSDNFGFMFYLVSSGLKDDALVLARHWPSVTDSASFAKGYAYYSARLLDSAACAFARVGEGSPLFAEALFFAALSQAHLGHCDRSASLLERVPEGDASLLNLKRFEQAGVSLLQRDLSGFDRHMAATDTTDFRLAEEARSLLAVRDRLAAHKPKSPFLAGALSAVVPGLGKVYAGSYGEGAAAFLLTGSLMAVTAENWLREGPANWKTIAAGLLSAVFYVGNIYGSAVTVKVAATDFNHQQDVQILYNIHIPLRNSYRR